MKEQAKIREEIVRLSRNLAEVTASTPPRSGVHATASSVYAGEADSFRGTSASIAAAPAGTASHGPAARASAPGASSSLAPHGKHGSGHPVAAGGAAPPAGRAKPQLSAAAAGRPAAGARGSSTLSGSGASTVAGVASRRPAPHAGTRAAAGAGAGAAAGAASRPAAAEYASAADIVSRGAGYRLGPVAEEGHAVPGAGSSPGGEDDYGADADFAPSPQTSGAGRPSAPAGAGGSASGGMQMSPGASSSNRLHGVGEPPAALSPRGGGAVLASQAGTADYARLLDPYHKPAGSGGYATLPSHSSRAAGAPADGYALPGSAGGPAPLPGAAGGWGHGSDAEAPVPGTTARLLHPGAEAEYVNSIIDKALSAHGLSRSATGAAPHSSASASSAAGGGGSAREAANLAHGGAGAARSAPVSAPLGQPRISNASALGAGVSGPGAPAIGASAGSAFTAVSRTSGSDAAAAAVARGGPADAGLSARSGGASGYPAADYAHMQGTIGASIRNAIGPGPAGSRVSRADVATEAAVASAGVRAGMSFGDGLSARGGAADTDAFLSSTDLSVTDDMLSRLASASAARGISDVNAAAPDSSAFMRRPKEGQAPPR